MSPTQSKAGGDLGSEVTDRRRRRSAGRGPNPALKPRRRVSDNGFTYSQKLVFLTEAPRGREVAVIHIHLACLCLSASRALKRPCCVACVSAFILLGG